MYIDAAGGLFFVIKDFGNDNKTIVGCIDKEALSYKSLYEQLRLEQFMYVQITRHNKAVLRTKILGYPEHF